MNTSRPVVGRSSTWRAFNRFTVSTIITSSAESRRPDTCPRGKSRERHTLSFCGGLNRHIRVIQKFKFLRCGGSGPGPPHGPAPRLADRRALFARLTRAFARLLGGRCGTALWPPAGLTTLLYGVAGRHAQPVPGSLYQQPKNRPGGIPEEKGTRGGGGGGGGRATSCGSSPCACRV